MSSYKAEMMLTYIHHFRSLLCVSFSFIGLLIALPAYADDVPLLPYVTKNDVDIIKFLPDPIIAGSADDLLDQQKIIEVQKSASSERIKRANDDVTETVFAMFGALIGDQFTAEHLPITAHFFARIGKCEGAIVDVAKQKFGRLRPFMANPQIKALVKEAKSGSYPSGHVTRSTMMAIVMADLFPDKRGALFARADDYAMSRIIGGMHYFNDLQAGERSGTAIAAVLFTRADFRSDLEAAREELKKAMIK
jgi:acid phosphatase (class A)